MVYQLPGHPSGQSSLHIKLIITLLHENQSQILESIHLCLYSLIQPTWSKCPLWVTCWNSYRNTLEKSKIALGHLVDQTPQGRQPLDKNQRPGVFCWRADGLISVSPLRPKVPHESGWPLNSQCLVQRLACRRQNQNTVNTANLKNTLFFPLKQTWIWNYEWKSNLTCVCKMTTLGPKWGRHEEVESRVVVGLCGYLE